MIIISYLYIYLLCQLKQLFKSEKDYLICVFTCQEQFAVNLTELHRHRERAGAILHWKQQQSDW